MGLKFSEPTRAVPKLYRVAVHQAHGVLFRSLVISALQQVPPADDMAVLSDLVSPVSVLQHSIAPVPLDQRINSQRSDVFQK
jgi:hypothetical protein